MPPRPHVGVNVFGLRTDTAAFYPRMSAWVSKEVTTATSMKEAVVRAKKIEPGKWKNNLAAPGDGKLSRVFRCNAHVDCGMLLRIVRQEGVYTLQMKGAHTTQPKLKARVNSALTYDEAERAMRHIDGGGKPGGIYSQMATAKWKELEDEGKDPLQHKKEEGGLEGE